MSAQRIAICGRLSRGPSSGDEVFDERLLFLQFVDRRVDARAAKIVDGHALDDLQFFAVAADGEALDVTFSYASGTKAPDSDALRARLVELRGQTGPPSR